MRRVLLIPAMLCVLSEPILGHGDLHERIQALSEEIQKSPATALLYFQRAELYSRHEEFEKALLDLQMAQTLEPEMDAVLALSGRIYRATGRLKQARLALENFLKRHPQNQPAVLDYALTLADLQETAAALEMLDKLIATAAAPSPDVMFTRLQITENQGKDAAAALHWLDGILQTHPLPSLQQEAVRLELALGKTDAAIRRLDGLIAQAPRPEFLLVRKAEALAAAGKTVESQAAAGAALQAIGKLPESQQNAPATAAAARKAREMLSSLTK